MEIFACQNSKKTLLQPSRMFIECMVRLHLFDKPTCHTLSEVIHLSLSLRRSDLSQGLLVAATMVVTPSITFAQAAAGPTPVNVVAAKTTDFTLKARLPGRIKASTEAEVRPQVSGIILERLFEEGADVKKGQPLYKIDDQNYASAVASADAALAEAKANFDLAVVDARRAADLFSNKSGSASNRDTAAAQQTRAAAALQKAQADLRTAEIDLDRTTIRAPIDGKIGLSTTTEGALVAAQQTLALTTIRTLDPIYVDVTQSATDLLRWHAQVDAGGTGKFAEAALVLPDGTTSSVTGNLTAAEPKVEPTTGMVTLRISFENPGQLLLPGLYVEVELPQAEAKNAILVPQSAVMRKTNGSPFAWIVADGKVEQRNLTIFATSGNELVTTAGLKEGDAVITSGFQKIAPGAPVQVIDAAANGSKPAQESK
ncbi:efflux RND transporter periplasmic adaptor subunit [Rhizobium panacihumi]|uniref:efflux RND transporter periplasmic adaptor subunit n=1 Tax=Rhizobium panacihumi TaxID=2008450 RepID=UPI003D78BBC9